MPKWIDVKDRLPDTTDTVIVRMKIDLLDNDHKLLATKPEIYVGKYTSHGWIFCHPNHSSGWKQYDDSHTLLMKKEVTHWMPIPDVDESKSEPTPELKYIIVHFLPKDQEIMLYVDKICFIYPSTGNAGCTIECVSGSAFSVRESYNEVQSMICENLTAINSFERSTSVNKYYRRT